MARPLCERASAGSPGTLGTQEQVVGGVLAVALPLLHELTKECRLLVAPSQHGRNGLSQIWRVRWFPHSAFSHGWISPKIFDYKQSTMEGCRKHKLNQKAEKLLHPNPEYPE